MNDYGKFNPDDLRVEVNRIDDEKSYFYRGSYVKVTHILTGEYSEMFGKINVSQKDLLRDCLLGLSYKVNL